MASKSAVETAKALNNVISVGDVHGKFRELAFRISKRYMIRDSVICLCGDIGMGFHKPNYYRDEWKYLDRAAKKGNNVIIGVRGNHDDPSYFDGGFGEEFGYTSIKLVPDYTVVETALDRILFIGGAVSIDRTDRTVGYDYWEGEMPVYSLSKLRKARKPSIIISHSAPSFAEPKDKSGLVRWMANDKKLYYDCDAERKVFDQVWDYLKSMNRLPQTWCYGHFHMYDNRMYENTRFVVTEELCFYPIRK
jgi:predicted phosphodiesterase